MVTPTLEVWLHTADRDRADLEMARTFLLLRTLYCMSLAKLKDDYPTYNAVFHGRPRMYVLQLWLARGLLETRYWWTFSASKFSISSIQRNRVTRFSRFYEGMGRASD